MDKFVWWLQGRLIAHGYAIAQDGDEGRETRDALIAFQRAKKIKQTGRADKRTVDALRAVPGKPKAPTPAPPADTMPPWMREMHRRMGLHEVRDNGVLAEWLRQFGKYLGDPAKLPWCGDAIETCIAKTLPNEVVPSNPFWAQAWNDFGIDAGGPLVGAIGVIKWNAKSGHVGIVAAYDAARDRVLLLGGNQSNAITLSWFPCSRFIAFRWPKTFPIQRYPMLRADGSSTGDFAGTR